MTDVAGGAGVAGVAELLAPVAAGLRADGYQLDAAMGGNRLSLRVSATDDACEDCLVPKSVMEGVVRSSLRRQGVAVDDLDVVITYPADNDALGAE